MPNMNDQHVARLEAQLERLVEGAFAHLFGKQIRAQDIAVQLARAMEDNAESGTLGDPRPIAPDHYIIYLNPIIRQKMLQRQPALATYLGEHITELATSTGYRLNNLASVDLEAEDSLSTSALIVKADHTRKKHSTTAVMQRVEIKPAATEAPRNPQLWLNGQQVIPLVDELINIGRSRDNQIVVDDKAVSRYHLQIRLRFGRYTLFDTQSRGGTYVNDILIKEHNLQSGDVIRIGETRLVYTEDNPLSDSQTGVSAPADEPSE